MLLQKSNICKEPFFLVIKSHSFHWWELWLGQWVNILLVAIVLPCCTGTNLFLIVQIATRSSSVVKKNRRDFPQPTLYQSTTKFVTHHWSLYPFLLGIFLEYVHLDKICLCSVLERRICCNLYVFFSRTSFQIFTHTYLFHLNSNILGTSYDVFSCNLFLLQSLCSFYSCYISVYIDMLKRTQRGMYSLVVLNCSM